MKSDNDYEIQLEDNTSISPASGAGSTAGISVTGEIFGSVTGVNLLLALNLTASMLLTANDRENIDGVLMSGLEVIGRAVDADRVNIWHNVLQSGEMTIERIYTWVSEYVKDTHEVPRDFHSPFQYFPDWHDKIRSNECAGGPITALPLIGQKFFASLGVQSIYLIPLFFSDSLWGVVSIDNCRGVRTYTDDEMLMLKSAGLMIASAITHQRTILDLVAMHERAEAAGKSKNAFLSNMSHEIRTPLNAIVGMAAIGRESESPVEKNHALSKIEDASAHLLEIITNVMDMARIEDGKLELIPVEFVFSDMLDKALAPIKPLAAEKNQALEVTVDSSIPHSLVGDDLRINQLITNLLTNAIKFTPIYGKISIDIALLSDTNEHIELGITVKDNGIGISEGQLPHLFVAFEQVHGALNHDYGGTGLGLPITKRIVELMDGDIRVESIMNRGTTVYTTIQLAKGRSDIKSAADNTQDDDKQEDACLIVPDEFKGKRLLVVEDIEINREIIIALLKKSGLIIECAEDGQVAVNMVMFNVDKYDIVFMDLQMPNMGGLEATELIRGLPARKRGRLPVIAMTANVLSDDIKACYEAGMDGHLSKPLDLDKVLKVLRKYLSE